MEAVGRGARAGLRAGGGLAQHLAWRPWVETGCLCPTRRVGVL